MVNEVKDVRLDKWKYVKYVIISLIVIIILGIIIYSLNINGVFDKKQNTLEINGITFVSDDNVVEQLIAFKNADKIIIYNESESDIETKYSGAIMILYTQIFSAIRKPYGTYLFTAKDEKCAIFDKDVNMVGIYAKSYCDNAIANKNFVIKIEDVDPSLENSKVVIENNALKFYAKDYTELLNLHHGFLQIIVDNLAEIEKQIETYVGTVGAKLNKN